ncbi:MAG: type II methionyl aminopeptidase [Thermoproteota archaeon]|jgi:methionine aminopeptidase, type II
MDEEAKQLYIKAGKIAANALKKAIDKIYIGMSLEEICNLVENEIINNGAVPAFPCNISINNIAAHNTADFEIIEYIPKNSVVKIDVGASCDGYLADTATTVCFNENFLRMDEFAKKALKYAIESIKPGKKTSEIGRIIFNVAKSGGFKVIKNLSGHSIKRNLLHAGKSIPNFDDGSNERIERDEVLAIEPFLTNGYGMVEDSDTVRIFSFKSPPRTKGLKHAEFINELWKERFYLPFCVRWYKDKINAKSLMEDLTMLMQRNELIGYNVLVETGKGFVVQEEHTVIIDDDEVIVTTIFE